MLCCKRHKGGPLTEQQLADRRHKRGWLSYAFASEAFVVVALTLFLPIALEQYARDNGRATPELVKPCTASDVPSDAGCKVFIGGSWIDTTSFSLYVNAASVAVQTLIVISMGKIADRAYYRKRLLLGFAWLGALCTIVFFALPSSSKAWPLVIPFAIIANVGYGASYVPLNAYLPGIAARDPAVLAVANGTTAAPVTVPVDVHAPPSIPEAVSDAEKALDLVLDLAPSTSVNSEGKAAKSLSTPELSGQTSNDAYTAAVSRAIAAISAQGIATGCAAGITMLIISLIPVILLGGSTLALRIAIGMSGIWWALGTVLALRWLDSGARPERLAVFKELGLAWVELAKQLGPREIGQLRNTFKFLVAWFLLSDGLTTITATAILFAKTTLHMPSTSLVILAALTPLAGGTGAIVTPYIQRRLGLSIKGALVVLMSLAALLPAYGALGLIPAIAHKAHPGGGLTASGEMYGAAIYFGFIYGAFQSYARALFGEIIPPGEESRWFALYSITDKSSSFVGPVIVGTLNDATGNIRWAFVFLLGMVLSAIPILAWVDEKRGRADAARYRRPA